MKRFLFWVAVVLLVLVVAAGGAFYLTFCGSTHPHGFC